MIISSGQNALFVKTVKGLVDKGLVPRIRLYHASSDRLKLRVLQEFAVRDLEFVAGSVDMRTIESYTLREFGKGFYCAKLFCTSYGRNILEYRYDFFTGGTKAELLEDEEDQEYF